MNFKAVTLSVILSLCAPALVAKDCVILLHGLSRTKLSMGEIGRRLEKDGFHVVNQGYPSRTAKISELSEEALHEALDECKDDENIDFVTHSMGGILLRDYYARHKDAKRPHRVVMLAPPNQGSAIVDDPRYDEMGAWWMGPAGKQLSEEPGSFVKSLPPVDYEVGVIAGNSSINPYFSSVLKGENDGAVSVKNTEVAGLKDWIVIKANHSFIMHNKIALEQVLAFLKNGSFDKN